MAPPTKSSLPPHPSSSSSSKPKLETIQAKKHNQKERKIVPTTATGIAVVPMKKKKKKKNKNKEQKKMAAAHIEVEKAFPHLKFHSMKKDLIEIIKDELHFLKSDFAMVTQMKDEILVSLRERCQVLIVVADWYSFKILDIPFYLAGAGGFGSSSTNMIGRIACTRPSSEAANSAATRAYLHIRKNGGADIGYRPERSSSNHRREGTIMFMSVDSLLEEMVDDRDLSSYSCIMVDDAHVRTLSTDVLLGMLLLLARRRPKDLRLLLTVTPSAKHEAVKLAAFFRRQCRTRTIIMRREPHHEPMILYVEPRYDDPIEAAVEAVIQVHRNEPPGRVLLFLGGDSKAVENACQALRQRIACASHPEDSKLVILPLYNGNSTEIVTRLTEAYNDPLEAKNLKFQRWVFVLGEDVPEASVEMFGSRYVVDTGLGKGGTRISRQSAYERTLPLALAGTGRNPKCFRLYKESVYWAEMAPISTPEILTCSSVNLSIALRLMMQLGIAEPWNFNFIDQPPPQAVASAMEHLAESSLPDISRLNLA